jgi:hypothetical protein
LSEGKKIRDRYMMVNLEFTVPLERIYPEDPLRFLRVFMGPEDPPQYLNVKQDGFHKTCGGKWVPQRRTSFRRDFCDEVAMIVNQGQQSNVASKRDGG